ncbi:GDYXXLXY domain-containing protein [Psychrobacter sp. YGAH215]|uniref:GDYXXLXY domain-containing protein n=1 Tax=Psychrobacter sp. YGAH215 TaxID=2596826 RepID=UPI001184B4BE|nr:GDYXXLXY domain-containing protein [Psychrobacter sp. YGAH215]TSB23186.1 GDYXXLXY domain-containing protein [Psychrobacter sp. YGAH215]
MNDKILTKRLLKATSKTHWLQKPAVTIIIALLGLALVLVVMTRNIIKYEAHLTTGDTVLLALAPVDPRAFMQGDYMTLSYALERDVFAALNKDPGSYPINEQGYVIVALDQHNVGQFKRLAANQPRNLASNEIAIYYRIRNGTMQLATNAFFFQEGHGEAFEAAEYGLFRINDKGEPLLTNLVDDDFKVISPKQAHAEQITTEQTAND